jgi:ABC-type dipeptide/oligopeptide/nickel transport systems, permease components
LGSLTTYIIKRFLAAIPTIIGAATLIFFLVRVLPGDPVHILAGEQTTPEIVERLRSEFGLDKPIYIQYLIYLKSIFTLDFGTSYRTYTPVISEILSRFPNTVILALSAMAISISLGVVLGIIMALRAGTILDKALLIFTSIYVSITGFLAGPYIDLRLCCTAKATACWRHRFPGTYSFAFNSA